LGRKTIKSYGFQDTGRPGDVLLEDGVFEDENEWRTFTFNHKEIIDFTLLVHSDYNRQHDNEAVKKAVTSFFEIYEKELKEPTEKNYLKQNQRICRLTQEDKVPSRPYLAEGIIEWSGVTKYFTIDAEGGTAIDLIAKHEKLENNALDKAVGRFAEIYLQEMHIPTK